LDLNGMFDAIGVGEADPARLRRHGEERNVFVLLSAVTAPAAADVTDQPEQPVNERLREVERAVHDAGQHGEATVEDMVHAEQDDQDVERKVVARLHVAVLSGAYKPPKRTGHKSNTSALADSHGKFL